MCVIITTPSRKHRPSRRNLRLCQATNAHGSGLAWVERRRVQYVKGLDADEIADRLALIDGPAIIHFRIASVGGVRETLCHPFPMTHEAPLRRAGVARSVLFHNGTFQHYDRYADHFGIRLHGPVSDTRVAASLAARFGFSWLEQFDYCRWAMLDAAHGIQRIGQWITIGACHYSNNYWNPEPWHRSPDWWKQS